VSPLRVGRAEWYWMGCWIGRSKVLRLGKAWVDATEYLKRDLNWDSDSM
jgi:hypothetical protein